MLRLGAAALVSAAATASNRTRFVLHSPLALATFKRSIASTPALSFARSNRALELKYKDGACTLAVPLPLSGFDEERVFSIAPEATVASIVAQIEAEDASVERVAVRSKRGKVFGPDATLNTILKDDFELVVNDRVLPVTAPVFAGNAYVSVLDDGALDVRAVTHKAAVISLRHCLETLEKWKISYADFERLCTERGIPKKQAPEILRAFHHAGIVFAFRSSTDEDLQASIFLQPQSVVDSFLATLGLSPVSHRLFATERQLLLAKIQALEPEHVALRNLQRELEAAATRHANAVAVGLSTTLVGTFGLYFWLSFIHFSWDIMEPVTYFTGFGASLLGYAWWSATTHEYEYENIYDVVYQRRLSVLTKRASFDAARLAAVTRTLAHARDQLARIDRALAKPTHLQATDLDILRAADTMWDDAAASSVDAPIVAVPVELSSSSRALN